jgi:hypothetical protein
MKHCLVVAEEFSPRRLGFNLFTVAVVFGLEVVALLH